MKQTNFLKSNILILFICLSTMQFVWGQGTENFQTQTALTTSYLNGSFTGQTSGVTVNYVHSRNEGLGTSDDYSITGKGIMLRRSDEPSSVEFVISNGGGVGTFSFDARKAFTAGTNTRILAVYANNNLIYTTPNFGTAGTDATVHAFSTDVNLSGNVTIKITYPAGTTNGNRQITIDNISWTAYSNEEPQDSPVVTAETFNGTVGMGASFQIQATESPDNYTIASGNLPAGLTLNDTTGLISGTPTTAGNSSVTVTATNDAGVSPAATISFEIAAGTQTVTPTLTDLSKYDTDAPFNLPATTDQGITITYNSSNTSVASVAGNTITIEGTGSTTITASNSGNSNYNTFNDSFTVTVTEEPEIYNGNGTFVRINSTDELTNGYYVIAANPDFGNWAMSNTHNGTFLSRTAITPTSETIINPDVTIVWKIESNGSGRTIYNDNSAKYVSFTGSSNNIQVVDAITTDNQRWNITFGSDEDEDDVFLFNNVAITTRILQYNSGSGSERFAAYTSNQRKLALYKLVESVPAGIIWTTANEWSNGTGPTISDDVIIEGDLTTTSDLSAKTLTVETGGSIVISSGNTFIVDEIITNNASASDFIVQNNANLIQNTGNTVDNIGNITVQKTSQPFKRLDYTMWSSPVDGQQIQGFSPETLPNRIYTYESDNYYAEADVNSNFDEGRGYLFRAPNNWSSDTATPYSGQFVGIPFNGDISVETYSNGFTSIGNPYASNIDADTFLATNPDVSSLYFWTNTNPVVGGTYSGNNYATYTFMGGVGTSGAENDEANAPNGFISVGQGFIVESIAVTAEFNNDMRVSDPATFFKVNDTERHRLWLNLKGENQGHNQILIGYMSGASNGIDKQIDAKMFGYEGSALYSVINEKKYTIQGRALPFENSDLVPLGFKAVQSGLFTISLIDFDGIFAEGNVTIYLKDNSTQTTHNLMESDYTFQSEVGEFNERFEIVYEEDGSMGTGDLTSASVQIYKNNQNIVVESKSEKILSVELYDLSGRNIHSNNKVNTNTYQIKSASKGVIVIKVQTENGKIFTKKIINN